MSTLGKAVRLGRILERVSGKAFFVTIDHPITRGVMAGLDDVRAALARIVEGRPDAITMHKGIAREFYRPYAGLIPFSLKATSFAPYHPTYDTVVADVEEALQLGADAISVGALVGGARQDEMLATLGRFAKEAHRAGLPLIAHIYPKGELIKEEERYSATHMAYAVRAGVELGVDVVKTWYTGSPETFRKVIAASHGRVIAAGGPTMETPRQLFEMTRGVMDAGALGVAYGRNIWQAKDPARMIEALKLLIHKKAPVEDALAHYGA